MSEKEKFFDSEGTPHLEVRTGYLMDNLILYIKVIMFAVEVLSSIQSAWMSKF